MRILILKLLILICIQFSCAEKRGEFINYDKWKVPDIYNEGYINGKPREVRSSLYKISDNIDSNAEIVDENIYRFDTDGNLIYYSTKIHYDSIQFLQAVGNVLFDSNGEHVEYCYFDESRQNGNCRSSSKLISQLINDSTYQVKHYKDGKSDYEELRLYKKNMVTKSRRYSDGRYVNIKLEYKNNRLVKSINTDIDGKLTTYYYRNDENILDSCKTTESNRIFFNNGFGHPIEFIAIESKDTIEHRVHKYIYDAKGNWISRFDIERRLVSFPFEHINNYLVKRVITY